MSVTSGYPAVDITAPDSDRETFCTGAKRLTIQISNQAVLITFGRGTPPIYDQPEPYLPVVGQIAPVGGFDAFKVRAKIPAAQLPAGATQAHVTLIPRN